MITKAVESKANGVICAHSVRSMSRPGHSLGANARPIYETSSQCVSLYFVEGVIQVSNRV